VNLSSHEYVQPRVLLDRRDHADRHPHQHRDEHGEQRELERGREAREELGGDRPAGDYGVAQVAPERVGKEDTVLDDAGLVEPHVRPHLLDLRLGRLLPEEQLRRVAGDGAHHEEHHDGDPEQHRDDLEEPAPDVLRQGL
jgi:hypothetical protein